MAYVKIIYQDSPSTATPLNAQNLNHMDDGIAENDRRLNELAIHNVKSFNGREGDIVSANGDYDISQIAPTAGATVGQIPILVNVGTEEAPEFQFELDDVPQTGHTIQGADGTDLAQEPTMQFVDAHLSDDNVGGKTVVETFKAVTEAEYSSETEDGAYIITDGDGAVIEPASEDYVEVVGDGTKTYATLLSELYSKIDRAKLSGASYLKVGTDVLAYIGTTGNPNRCFFGLSGIYNNNIYIVSILLKSDGIIYQYYDTTAHDISSNVVAIGGKLTLYYGNKKATVDLQTTANRCWYDSNNTVKQKIDEIKVKEETAQFTTTNHKWIIFPTERRVISAFLGGQNDGYKSFIIARDTVTKGNLCRWFLNSDGSTGLFEELTANTTYTITYYYV